MKFAYKAVRIHTNGKLTSILANISSPCCVEYKRGQIARPYGGKFFVYSQKPTRKQLERVSTDANIRVFKCVVDDLVKALNIPKGWSGNVNDTWFQFWAGALNPSDTQTPLEDTYFCNEVMLLNDVTRSIK